VQAFSTWTPPGGTLGAIVGEARERVRLLESDRKSLTERARAVEAVPPFGSALRRSNVAVIAEVKRRSPSKGWIKAEIAADEQAAAYENGGAAAVSVLTEPKHFGGSINDLLAVRERTHIPVLKKDFHVDPIQLLEAKAIGASAALLIVRALAPDALKRMIDAAAELRLEVLVEVRDAEELERALGAGAQIIGVNNRNLETLHIDPANAERIIKSMPASVIAIAESGVSSASDVERISACGADAVLVGSAISAASDPAAKVRELAGVKRVPRG
jgi:indole-3-glycerol phosphate synthase